MSKALADRFWPDGSAIGKRFRPYDRMPWQTIVGVVGDVDRWDADGRTPFRIYSPWARPSSGSASAPPVGRRGYVRRTVLVRATDAAAVIPAIKAAVWSLDRTQPIDRVVRVAEVYAGSFSRQRFVLEVMTTFGAVAVFLTAVGLFGVLSEIVARKTREIGIRVALGARHSDVLRLVVSRGMALALAGTVLGLAGAAALTRFLGALLFEVRPIDPLSFAAVACLMLAVALLACWLPARRALRVGPAEALRID